MTDNDADTKTGDEDTDDEALDPRLEEGWQALSDGDTERALEAARTCAREETLRLDAWMLESACHRETGDAQAALATLAQMSKAEPEWCEPALWSAELLLEGGEDLDGALKHARRALDLAEEEDEYLGALALKAAIELELDRPTEARKTLTGLPPADASLGDPARAVELAQLLIDVGAPAEARTRMETVLAEEPDHADAWYVSGVAAEVTGDEAKKREAWVRARALDLQAAEAHDAAHDGDGGAHHHHVHLTEAALIAIAEETLAELPPEIRQHLTNVPIIVADLPAASDVADGMDPRLLGVFHGASHGENGSTGDLPALTEIVLFRRNIERVAHDEDDARAEVELTLLHETGHYFGLDEAALARLDLD